MPALAGTWGAAITGPGSLLAWKQQPQTWCIPPATKSVQARRCQVPLPSHVCRADRFAQTHRRPHGRPHRNCIKLTCKRRLCNLLWAPTFLYLFN